MDRVSTDMILRVDDGHGYHYLVQYDPDCLGMVEIRYVEYNVESATIISFNQETAHAIIGAMQRIMAFQKEMEVA